jgi:hypothetical protein
MNIPECRTALSVANPRDSKFACLVQENFAGRQGQVIFAFKVYVWKASRIRVIPAHIERVVPHRSVDSHAFTRLLGRESSVDEPGERSEQDVGFVGETFVVVAKISAEDDECPGDDATTCLQ